MGRKNYAKFATVDLSTTGIIEAGSVVFNRLKKNGITTLQELFKRDDEGNIDYGSPNVTGSANFFIDDEIKGVIELLRYKYLNEDIMIDSILVSSFDKENADGYDLSLKTKKWKRMGFSIGDIRVFEEFRRARRLDSFTYIEFLKNFKEVAFPSLRKTSGKRIEHLQEKLDIIFGYWDQKQMLDQQDATIEPTNERIAELLERLKQLNEESKKIEAEKATVEEQLRMEVGKAKGLKK